jgi:hypothetical protein
LKFLNRDSFSIISKVLPLIPPLKAVSHATAVHDFSDSREMEGKKERSSLLEESNGKRHLESLVDNTKASSLNEITHNSEFGVLSAFVYVGFCERNGPTSSSIESITTKMKHTKLTADAHQKRS